MIERLPRSLLLAMSLASIASVSTAQVTHTEHNLGWANGAVTNTALDGRLSQAAMQYRSYAPVPRIAFYDIAFPKDCAEFASMSGHAMPFTSSRPDPMSERGTSSWTLPLIAKGSVLLNSLARCPNH